MLSRMDRTRSNDAHGAPKWFSSPVTYLEGPLAVLRELIPTFQRRSLGLANRDNTHTRLHPTLDLIVRCPVPPDEDYVPVGTVSKGYTLVPHQQVLDAVHGVLRSNHIVEDDIDATLAVTEFGERMALSVCLPKEYCFDPGDGHKLTLRIECLNSVDGTTRLQMLMGWFRFVCGNGLVLGVATRDIRRRHSPTLTLDGIPEAFSEGLEDAKAERTLLTAWRGIPVGPREVGDWADTHVCPKWGFKAASRAFHIATTGCDAEVAPKRRGDYPTTAEVRSIARVPGAPACSANLFDISQVLAWLAKERRDLQEQLDWRGQIPSLLEALAPNNRTVGGRMRTQDELQAESLPD